MIRVNFRYDASSFATSYVHTSYVSKLAAISERPPETGYYRVRILISIEIGISKKKISKKWLKKQQFKKYLKIIFSFCVTKIIYKNGVTVIKRCKYYITNIRYTIGVYYCC